MANWRPFDDPLLADANWPHRSVSDLERWYTQYSQDPRRLLCAVTNKTGQVIGSITLRERDARRSARLGITLGADYVDLGLGTEALTLFLDYYFGELGFEKLVLDVAGCNRRAIRVYQKFGFTAVGQHERSLQRHKKWAFLNKPAYASVRQFFRRDWAGRRWQMHFDMELTKADWEKQQEPMDGS
jgi:RimJ/RimL family protein N-acetyltransferase